MTKRAVAWFDQFREDWMAGCTLRAMAEARGMTRRAVLMTAQRMGLPRRPRRRKLSSEAIELIHVQLNRGMNVRQLAQRFRVDWWTVRRVIPDGDATRRRRHAPPMMRRCLVCHGKELTTSPHQP